MAAKGMKRLEILLPESHPLFDHPPRWRSKVAREWLDLGARLAAVEHEIRNLQRRVADLQHPARICPGDQPAYNESPGTGFSAGSFTKTLTDAFG
jgi:hypothetical protein